jgi:hypothetical protein
MLLKVGVAMMALALAFPAAVAFAAFLFAEPMEGPLQMFTDVNRGWCQPTVTSGFSCNRGCKGGDEQLVD